MKKIKDLSTAEKWVIWFATTFSIWLTTSFFFYLYYPTIPNAAILAGMCGVLVTMNVGTALFFILKMWGSWAYGEW